MTSPTTGLGLLEKVVEKLQRRPGKPRARRVDIPDAHVRHLADALQRHFGTGVRITPSSSRPTSSWTPAGARR